MTQRTHLTRLNPVRSRRQALGLLGVGALMLGIEAAPGSARGQSDADNVLTEALVLRDPEMPMATLPSSNISTINVPIAARWRRSCGRWCRATARSGWC